MPRLISTIATMAAVVSLTVGLWHDWGLLAVLKRMVLSYLGFFILGSVMALIVRSTALFETPVNTIPETGEPQAERINKVTSNASN